jgi:hypothetical protein
MKSQLGQCCDAWMIEPFRRPLISPNLAESSSFLKSFVFCARSLRCTVESRWYVTISDAVLSRFVTNDVRSISANVSGNAEHFGLGSIYSSMLILLAETCFHRLGLGALENLLLVLKLWDQQSPG